MAATPSPFGFRDYRFYWCSRLTATLAQMAMVIVIGWQVYDIARSQGMTVRDASFQLGLIGVVQFVPLLLLALVVGWTADRIDRRWVARAAVLLEAFCALALAIMAHRHSTTLPALFGIAALLGVARAFAQPAIQAIAPNLVPRSVLPSAIALSSVGFTIGAVMGPAMGGYLYAESADLPYWTSTALFLTAFTCLMFIRPLPPSTLDRGANPWRQMIDGLAYVRRNRLVLGALSLDLFAVLLGGATAMLPVFARDVLHVGAEGLGELRAAPAFGAAAVALWFSFHPLRNEVGAKMLISVVAFGVATIAFGASKWMPLSLLCLGVLGAADMVSVYVRQSLIQLHTPDEMRGRVGAVGSVFVSGSNELGEAESGLLAALVGPVTAVIAGGVGAILVAALWAKLFPELLAARTFDPPQTLEDAPTGTTPRQETAT